MNIAHSKDANRIGKLKLMKDLKYGKVHLRQSLIELCQFEDVNKIYKNRKQLYSIHDQKVNITRQSSQQNQQEVNILISPIERIQMYRKQKMNKKLNEKMIQSLVSKQIKYNHLRIPKTTKLLQKFQTKYRNEMHISYKEQLKESQLNLEKLKRNDKIKYEINNQNCRPLYQSRSVKNPSLICQQQQQDASLNENKRFISLKTSLPQKQKFIYPSLRQIMEGKLRQKSKGPILDIKNIQNSLENYLDQNIRKIKVKIQKQIDTKHSAALSPTKLKSQPNQSISFANQNKKRANSNVQKSFTRSQQSSKKMIDTMSSFYETKHQKNNNFERMHKNLKYDRPLTSSIRRRNYTVLGKQSLNPIDIYRQSSQYERKKIRQKNHEFYCKLIKNLELYHHEDIPTTVYIVEEVKRVFQTQYIFTQKILQELLQTVNEMEMDLKTQEILKQVSAFIGYKLKFMHHAAN